MNLAVLLATLLLSDVDADHWFKNDPVATDGNKISLLTDGETLRRNRIWLILNAKQSIYLSSYYFIPDNAGKETLSALCMKAQEGIEVRVMVDSYGSAKLKKEKAAIRNCGINFMIYNPLNWGGEHVWYSLHEKLLIVDGKTVVTGGSGYANMYNNYSRSNAKWYDLDIRIDGPAACSYHNYFVENWLKSQQEDEQSHSRDPLTLRGLSPGMHKYLYGDNVFSDCKSTVVGTSRVIPIFTNPRFSKDRPLLQRYYSLGMAAKKQIKLYAPYFIPHKDFKALLELATKKGVEVSAITNSGKSNDESPAVSAAMYKNAIKLIRAGVKVYMWSKTSTMHRKAGIYDSRWAFVGSDNQDVRGQNYSSENVAFFDEPEIVKELERQFDEDIKASELMTINKLQKLLKEFSGLTNWEAERFEDVM